MHNNKKNINIILNSFIALLIYHFTVIRFYYFNYDFNFVSLIILLIILLIYILPKINKNNNKSALILNCVLLIMSVFIILSSLVNAYNIDGSLLYILRINILMLFFELAVTHENIINICKMYAYFNILYLGVTYFYIKRYPLMAYKNMSNYFLGTKFYVSYLCLFTLALIYVVYNKLISSKFIYKVVYILLSLFVLKFVLLIKCTTGIVGLIIFLSFIVFQCFLEKFIYKPRVIVAINVICCVIVFVMNKLLQTEFVKNIVVDFLGKDLTLTGRTIVYTKIIDFIIDKPLLGYGYNSVYSLFKNVMKIGKNAYALDAQNAMLEFCLYFGIIGVVLMNIYIYLLFSKLRKNKFMYGICSYIYVMCLLGIAEITINMLLYISFTILYSLSNLKDIDKCNDKIVYKV